MYFKEPVFIISRMNISSECLFRILVVSGGEEALEEYRDGNRRTKTGRSSKRACHVRHYRQSNWNFQLILNLVGRIRWLNLPSCLMTSVQTSFLLSSRLKYELDLLFNELASNCPRLSGYKSDGPLRKLEMLSNHWRKNAESSSSTALSQSSPNVLRQQRQNTQKMMMSRRKMSQVERDLAGIPLQSTRS